MLLQKLIIKRTEASLLRLLRNRASLQCSLPCGDLGLLGVDAPEAYGGVALDKVTAMVVSERISEPASFGATFGAQVNLTVLPLVLGSVPPQAIPFLERSVAEVKSTTGATTTAVTPAASTPKPSLRVAS